MDNKKVMHFHLYLREAGNNALNQIKNVSRKFDY